MLFFFSFFIINFNYIFGVVSLVLMVLWIVLVVLGRMVFLKLLIMVVYLRGVVVFVIYISCLCWPSELKIGYVVLVFCLFVLFLFDLGLYNIMEIGSGRLRMYVFFGFLFSVLVIVYSLILFRSSGSLRF